MLAVISWWVLDGYCHFLLCPGWLPFFPYGPWMVTGISQQLKYLHRACTVRAPCPVLPLSELLQVVRWWLRKAIWHHLRKEYTEITHSEGARWRFMRLLVHAGGCNAPDPKLQVNDGHKALGIG